MKLFLMLTFLLCTTLSFCQTDTLKSVLIKEKKWINNSAGLELQKYTKHHYTGMLTTLGGLAMLGSGGFLYLDGGGNIFLVMTSVGAAAALFGTYLTLEAPIHIKRAGIIFNSNGIGLKYSF